MPSRPEGNAAKRIADFSPGPWASWPETDRAERAIRFITTYCRPAKGFRAGEPLELAGFQTDWLREVLAPGVSAAALELPRGNGKSTLLAALALWALFDPDPRAGEPQIPIVATTIGQAIKTVYGPAVKMINNEPELYRRSKQFTAIGATKTLAANDGEMFPISNDPDGLQGLDPSVGVCDEIGFMPQESWTSLLQASGKRPASVVVGIGTPGFDRDSALWFMRERVRSGENLPGFRFREYAAPEGCAVLDEKMWMVANPALEAGFMDIDAMRMLAAVSLEAHFRIFRLGQWIEGVESWLGEDGRKLWRRLEDPWPMQPDAPTWVGVDVALKHDTTAISWCQQRPDGRWHTKARIWHPRTDGRLDVTDAMKWLRDLASDYDIKAIAFDARFFDLPAQQLLDEGFPMVEIPQNVDRMTPACGNAFEMIKRGELSHDGAPDLEAHVLNAVARYNERGFTLAKSKSKDKIDACIAMILALSLAQSPEEKRRKPLVAMV